MLIYILGLFVICRLMSEVKLLLNPYALQNVSFNFVRDEHGTELTHDGKIKRED